MRGLPCLICRRVPSENAHTANGGMGRKADCDTIAPLCHVCHIAYDEHTYPCDDALIRQYIAKGAAITESAWQAHCEASA